VSEEYRRYRAEDLSAFETGVLVKLGMSEEDARIAAWTLTRADLLGVDSHGIAHFADGKGYVAGLRQGIVNPKAKPSIVHETPSTALMHGDCGMGIINGAKAMQIAMEKAKQVGSGFVAVTCSRHFGMTAHYTLMAAEQDMIGIAMTNTVPSVAPTGGMERRIGTNPIAVAVPAGEEPTFSLDIATSAVANGKLELARIRGEAIPEGWAIDKEGNPTTDPRATQQGGMLLPLGSTATLSSYKGYGLGVMVDIFSGVLSGLGFCRMIDMETWEMGHFVGAWRIDAFRPADEFKRMMDKMIRELRATKPAPGSRGVMVPGEKEHLTQAERRERGVPLHPKVVAPLAALGEEMGVPFPAPK
jgi:LDH2 family malate/lactate/ureidoglycolate dehydrogenase